MSTIRVKCPHCREVMEVNNRTGRIEKHHPEIKSKAGGDFLKERLKGLEEEKASSSGPALCPSLSALPRSARRLSGKRRTPLEFSM